MANGKNVTVGQMRELAEKTDERLDGLELSVVFVRITIPAAAWVEATDADAVTAGFAYQADVAVDGLTANDYVETILDMASVSSALTCSLSATSASFAGFNRYFAKTAPTAAITAQLVIRKTITKEGTT